jgi:hypothetical protein
MISPSSVGERNGDHEFDSSINERINELAKIDRSINEGINELAGIVLAIIDPSPTKVSTN